MADLFLEVVCTFQVVHQYCLQRLQFHVLFGMVVHVWSRLVQFHYCR